MPSGKVIHGRVRVRAHGAQIERLINSANKRGIVLHDVRYEEAYTVVFCVGYEDFIRMRPAFRESRCRAKILSKSGLPRLRSRLRARVMLAVGAVVCLILLLGFSQMVWSVSLMGVEEEHEAIVREVLTQAGVHPGVLRESVDRDALAEEISRQVQGLSFVGVRMQGLTLVVETVYSAQPPEVYDRNQPVHVVAAQDGVIERILVMEGEAAVEPGQAVRKGDILIRGLHMGRMVHARGEVLARIPVQGVGEAPLYEEVSTPTGQYYNRTLLWILDFIVPIYDAPAYEHYQIAAREKEILPYYFLPAGIRRETVHEIQVNLVPRPEGVAEREAEQAALLDALAKLPDNTSVVDKWVEYGKIKENTLQAVATLQSLRDIGQERPY